MQKQGQIPAGRLIIGFDAQCLGNAFPCDLGKPDMAVIPDIDPVIKEKGVLERVGIGQEADKDHENKPRPQHLPPGTGSDIISIHH
jgi:hypothetical protein